MAAMPADVGESVFPQKCANLPAGQDPESPNGHFYARNVDLAFKTLPDL